jgi:thiamine biosynthesis lipoprotein
MATEFTITVYPRAGERADVLGPLLDEIFEDVDQLEAIISEWKPDSQTTYVNNHAAAGPVRVSPELMTLLVASRDLYRRTGGAFDVTVGPLSELYGFYKKQGHVPSGEELSEALDRVGMDKVTLNQGASTVSFAKPGMRLDFGGIGKGFALDRAVETLKSHGVTRALLSAGTSSIYAIGAPPGEPGWTVRIQHPYNNQEAVAEVVLRDESLSTSGCYGDLPVVDGVRICNIFDPRTGHARHGVVSASAIAATGTETDALGKAFLILGVDEARRFCARYPGVRAVIVPETAGDTLTPVWIGQNTGQHDRGVHHEP